MNEGRVPPRPSQVVNRTSEVTFRYDGRTIRGYEGDTIASALHASGLRTFTRSFKYHRPRGLHCVSGRCPNCLMTVDGVPNVRTCTRPVQQGMQVRHQNAWPSLEHDFLSFLDRLDPLLPVGFYYKSFVRPKFTWRLAQPIIRRVAGLGRIDIGAVSEGGYEHYNQSVDVAVVGGGPAGISAAVEAARAGARVILVDDQPSLGGHLRFDVSSHPEAARYPGMAGYEIAAHLAAEAQGTPNLEVLTDAIAFGLYEGNHLGVAQGTRLVRLRCKSIVVATGCQEVPTVFHGNDLPGVMLSTGVQRLMHLYGVRPGTRALVVTDNYRGYPVARELLEAGIDVVALADAREAVSSRRADTRGLEEGGVSVLAGHAIKEARGGRRVRQATLVDLKGGDERRYGCDLVCTATSFDPATSLLYMAGCRLEYDEAIGETVPTEMVPGIYVAGDVTGTHDLQAAILQGTVAGIEAASSLMGPDQAGRFSDRVEGYGKELADRKRLYRDQLHVEPLLVSPGPAKKKFVCLCEDVTEGDLHRAIAEGFDEMQTLKRYSTLSMGPCQGKMCLKACVAICAERTGRTIQETGTTTSRPPLGPIPLGMLAGPSHMPVKLTPLDRVHRELGARMMDLGPWKRPHSYGSPQEECQAVRHRVGIIDVSTLGKLDVQGRDAPALLDKVYTHIFSTLPVGRIRYGLLCSDNGMIIDDGTITRLAEDHYFITTTTGNVELMEEWLKWWAAGTDMRVYVNNVTPGYAAINVAGPRARDTLVKLTDVDLSASGFRYMRSARGEVAGVPSLLLRIGFVGETGWEIHFPAEYGEHVWDALMEAGKEFGIAPFGVEAQRILRLEKKHVIIGQDTDIVSNPLEGDMSWVVRFDKEDFIGKHALEGIQERGLRGKLVGFLMDDSTVPEDGVPVVDDGRPVGRVTSSRMSPTLGRGFGFVWVPVEFSEEGREIHIQVNGVPLPAKVTGQPVYDPEGKRLRE